MVKIRNFQALFEGFVPQTPKVPTESVKPQCPSSEPLGAEDFSKMFYKSSNTSNECNPNNNSADEVLSAYWSQ